MAQHVQSANSGQYVLNIKLTQQRQLQAKVALLSMQPEAIAIGQRNHFGIREKTWVTAAIFSFAIYQQWCLALCSQTTAKFI